MVVHEYERRARRVAPDHRVDAAARKAEKRHQRGVLAGGGGNVRVGRFASEDVPDMRARVDEQRATAHPRLQFVHGPWRWRSHSLLTANDS